MEFSDAVLETLSDVLLISVIYRSSDSSALAMKRTRSISEDVSLARMLRSLPRTVSAHSKRIDPDLLCP